MARRAWLATAALVIVGICLVAASDAGAAPAGQVCPSFTAHGLSFRWSTAGTMTCSAAKPWVLKLIKDRVHVTSSKVALHNGPTRYHCYAEAVRKGYVSTGICYKGTLAYPISGFQWLS